ncbi:MAG: hypothetical protein ED555_08100 [Allomuricauda sp.]|nr:MAG: hypothetical protein ED555_08100 [Allomuricauda sp.]
MNPKRLLLFFLCIPIFAFAQNDCNCCSTDHKGFDFWLGAWTVNNADGSPAGQSLITKEEDGCVIRENWISAKTGFTGTSLNFYNATDKQWEQLWVDNSGNHLKLKGMPSQDQMILESAPFQQADGITYTNRITWTKNQNGTVRQLWELLEGDQVRKVLFDGLYTKVER